MKLVFIVNIKNKKQNLEAALRSFGAQPKNWCGVVVLHLFFSLKKIFANKRYGPQNYFTKKKIKTAMIM